MEEEIIQPIDKEVLKRELTSERQLRMTNKSHNEIYIITAHEAPNVMKEIGRLREIAFRSAGGGTGKSMDIDEFDTMDNCYKQLIVWNPEEEEIIGGYRYLLGTDVDVDANGQPILATSHMFHFSDKFMKEYMPQTIELGRSFVSVDYQSTRRGAKSLFALDNLWDGLGALIVNIPDTQYFFGKVTVYPHYNSQARDLLFGFINKHFPDKDNLVYPIDPFKISITKQQIDDIFTSPDYDENYKILKKEVRNLGTNIPPLVNAYMSLSPCMRSFGFGVYHDFGELIECCILVPIEEMHDEKKQRHIETFLNI